MSIIFDALKKAAMIKKSNETADTKKESQTTDSSDKITSIDLETKAAKRLLTEKRPKRRYALVFAVTTISIAILIMTALFLLNNYLTPKGAGIRIGRLNQVFEDKIQPAFKNTTLEKLGLSAPFELTGIAYTDNEPMAVINGSVYTEGEYVSGAKITKINERSVLLEKEGKQIELQVKK